MSLRVIEHLRNRTSSPSWAPQTCKRVSSAAIHSDWKPGFFQHGKVLASLSVACRPPALSPGRSWRCGSVFWPVASSLFPAPAAFPESFSCPCRSLLTRKASERERGEPSYAGSFLFEFFLWFLTSSSPLSHPSDTASGWPAFGGLFFHRLWKASPRGESMFKCRTHS